MHALLSLLSLLSSLGALIVTSHAAAFLAGVALVLLELRVKRAPSHADVERLVALYRARYRGDCLPALREHRLAASMWARARERELLARVAAVLEAGEEARGSEPGGHSPSF
jgi:hypothetical protein